MVSPRWFGALWVEHAVLQRGNLYRVLLVPEGPLIVARHFSRGLCGKEVARAVGTLKTKSRRRGCVPTVPSGTGSNFFAQSGVKTPDYFQASLTRRTRGLRGAALRRTAGAAVPTWFLPILHERDARAHISDRAGGAPLRSTCGGDAQASVAGLVLAWAA